MWYFTCKECETGNKKNTIIIKYSSENILNCILDRHTEKSIKTTSVNEKELKVYTLHGYAYIIYCIKLFVLIYYVENLGCECCLAHLNVAQTSRKSVFTLDLRLAT